MTLLNIKVLALKTEISCCLILQGIFIKDSNSLAYYNMNNGSVIHLALKERGGRKK